MDPYIEACGLWGDFHSHLISEIKRALAEAAPDRYLVRTGVRSYIVLVDSEGKNSYPLPPNFHATARAEVGDDAEPVTMRAFIEEEHREAFVEIYEATPEQRLVTTVEILSPPNKRPNTPGWDLYQSKRQSVLLGSVHLVEIDLLRGGQRMPMLDPWPDSPYTLLVARAQRFQLCKVWPVHFQQPLPTIPIPLTKPDPDIPLSLQPALEAIYRRSRYEQSIDYTKPLSPPLGAEEAAWLKQQLRRRSGQR
jgi:hypothetical protein